ncbi:MAG: hypothetical protein Q4E68_07170 [Prevotellaceae bacterium]|nr:hypothetical protein [Prevotellaceae bacterium]
MSTGQIVFTSPELTGLNEPIRAQIIKIRKNPFVGTEIAVKDELGRIFFGPESFFYKA